MGIATNQEFIKDEVEVQPYRDQLLQEQVQLRVLAKKCEHRRSRYYIEIPYKLNVSRSLSF